MKKRKYLNLVPKMLNLRIFTMKFKNSISIIEISVLELVLLQGSVQKQKPLNLGEKMSDLGIFGLEFENNIVLLKISTLNFV